MPLSINGIVKEITLQLLTAFSEKYNKVIEDIFVKFISVFQSIQTFVQPKNDKYKNITL